MNGFLKVFNVIFMVLAGVACLSTVGVVVYSVVNSNGAGILETAQLGEETDPPEAEEQDPGTEDEEGGAQEDAHQHEYVESLELAATCISTGLMRYTCECGDYYLEDIPEVGHKAGDWETVREATKEESGLQVKKCIYCDEVIAGEYVDWSPESDTSSSEPEHIHIYVPTTESEPTCTTAGVRRFDCECESYYKESIPALGHLVGDWYDTKAATVTEEGIMQRICSECHTLIDSRVTPKLSPSPSPSASTSPSPLPSGASPTPKASPTPTPAPTPIPHSHSFNGFVYREPTCTTIGVMTYNCSCGAEYSESIKIDSSNHNYVTTVIPPTEKEKGYSQHICSRCGDSYTDNIVPALKSK